MEREWSRREESRYGMGWYAAESEGVDEGAEDMTLLSVLRSLSNRSKSPSYEVWADCRIDKILVLP